MVRQRRDESVPYWQSSQKSGVFTGQCKVHQALPSLESIEPSSVRFLLPMQGCSIKHVSHLESLEPSSVRLLYCECKGVASSTSPPPIAQYLRRTPDTVIPARERKKGKHFQAFRRKEGGKGGATNYRISKPPDSKFGGLLLIAKVRATSKLYSSLKFVGLSIFIHDFISTGESGRMCGPEYATSSRPGLWGCKKGQQSFIVTHPLYHRVISFFRNQ